MLGEQLVVSADIVRPGQDLVTATLNWRMQKENASWLMEMMLYSFDADSWSSVIPMVELGICEFYIEAWRDDYSTTLRNLAKWASVGEDVSSEVNTLLQIIEGAEKLAAAAEKEEIADALEKLDPVLKSVVSPERTNQLLTFLSAPKFSHIVIKNAEKPDYSTTKTFKVIVDRQVAKYSAWYEMFLRSQGTIRGKSGTFRDGEERLPEIRDMGFDVVYLPPLHPIGKTNKRGPNNTLSSSSSDPGSPWAVGSDAGGHYSIHPELGTMDDFLHFVFAARKMGLETAIDLAFQVSPDHPYVKNHPEWFYHRKDGTIRYAENPPKKYYDIYPLNFESDNWKELWEELSKVVEFWVSKGIKIFRVDNPHTKPAAFWKWLIAKIRSENPDVIFLAEAFTRPKTMKLLAKIGFDQSYTYFAWKNTKYELVEFLEEFVLSEAKEYYRGNFFTNTPDILSEYLQKGGRPAFKIREVLAATLSSSYGIYNGFELCEARPASEGSEEYLDSEKYQYRVWDWNREGNIKDYIAKINRIRQENPALHETNNLRLLPADNDRLFFYGKWNANKSNVILVAVNLNPFATEQGFVSVPIQELGLQGKFEVLDLITEKSFTWNGEKNFVRLDPFVEPAHVLRLVE